MWAAFLRGITRVSRPHRPDGVFGKDRFCEVVVKQMVTGFQAYRRMLGPESSNIVTNGQIDRLSHRGGPMIIAPEKRLPG